MANNRAPKRRFKWVGVQDIFTVKTFVSTTAAIVPVLCAPIVDGDIQADCMVERVLCHIQTRRLLTSTVEGFGYIVAKQKFDSSGGVVQILDPLSTDIFDLGNKDIMSIGRLEVDPIVNVDTLDVQVGKGLVVTTIDVKVRRKLERLTDGITLTVTADISDVMRVGVMARVLLSFR